MDLVIVLSTQGAQCNMLAPTSCRCPFMLLPPDYLSAPYGRGIYEIKKGRKDLCICKSVFVSKVDHMLFLRTTAHKSHKKKSAFHMQPCKTPQDALTQGKATMQKRNINSLKRMRMCWIVVDVLSNAPSLQTCHLAPATGRAIAAVSSSPLHIYPPNTSH